MSAHNAIILAFYLWDSGYDGALWTHFENRKLERLHWPPEITEYSFKFVVIFILINIAL